VILGRESFREADNGQGEDFTEKRGNPESSRSHLRRGREVTGIRGGKGTGALKLESRRETNSEARKSDRVSPAPGERHRAEKRGYVWPGSWPGEGEERAP